ncbi:hypothetical protein [Marinobacterium jannaschii]|uniref:hypothetical protein n=1 Tax=Marinobacterium jannaschii TaxID=64970 RepID=UPI00048A1018|nr:hypothetical protein [Marinobacterium jannaschii]
MESYSEIILLLVIAIASWGLWIAFEILRRRRLQKVAHTLGFNFEKCSSLEVLDPPQSSLFDVNATKQYLNILSGEYRKTKCSVFCFSYWVDAQNNTHRENQTVFVFESNKTFPFIDCTYRKKAPLILVENIPEALDIEIRDQVFDPKYRVQAGETSKAKRLLKNGGSEALLEVDGLSMTCQGNKLMLYVSKKRSSVVKFEEELECYYGIFKKLEAAAP